MAKRIFFREAVTHRPSERQFLLKIRHCGVRLIARQRDQAQTRKRFTAGGTVVNRTGGRECFFEKGDGPWKITGVLTYHPQIDERGRYSTLFAGAAGGAQELLRNSS
jgi:hypothetical protein